MSKDAMYIAKQESIHQVVQNLLDFKRTWRVQNRRLQDEYGISSQKVAILRRLDADGPMTVGQIAGWFCVSLPTASEVIDDLGGMGYVVSRIGLRDARKRWIEVTDQGRAVAETAPLTVVERVRAHLSSLETDELVSIGNAIAEITSCISSGESDNDQ